LVENSLAAGATHVSVVYCDGEAGPSIAVVDDGRGIPADELELAVARHATSKLAVLDDLQSIATFGFRGEALASIAAVSTLDLISRPADRDVGALVSVHCGEVVARDAAPSRKGTRVAVKELFASVPARRKFLKSAAAEYGAAAEHVRRFALARPDVHFVLERNGRKTLDLPPVAMLSQRLGQVLGRDVGVGLIALDGEFRGMRVTGAVSPAGVSFGSARRVFLFVNGRWVQDRALFRAVMEAYRTYLLKGRYPAAAIFLEVQSAAVDVNVHPAKLEVRFLDSAGVSAFVVEAVQAALRGASGPLGRWGLGERDLLATEAFVRRRRGGTGDSRSVRPGATSARDKDREETIDLAELPGYRPTPAAAGTSAVAEYASPGTGSAGDRGRDSSLSAHAAVEPLPLGSEPPPGTLGSATVIGQVLRGYIVCEAGEELVLVDQHAAHERI
jgi:DNA mismatch repair protein MutL